MTHHEAVLFLQNGIKPEPGNWLDLGAGNGTFTLALAELLAAGSTIYAIDKDGSVLNIPKSNASNRIVPLQADFNNLPELPAFDGILMANALHYVKTPIPFLQKLLENLRPGGAFILMEYDIVESNPWVPYPITFQSWKTIASEAGLSDPMIFNEKSSLYRRGMMYAAISFLEK